MTDLEKFIELYKGLGIDLVPIHDSTLNGCQNYILYDVEYDLSKHPAIQDDGLGRFIGGEDYLTRAVEAAGVKVITV